MFVLTPHSGWHGSVRPFIIYFKIHDTRWSSTSTGLVTKKIPYCISVLCFADRASRCDFGLMTNLMHNCVIQDVYCYNPLHVSSNSVLIIRRSNCINTVSGIVLSVGDRPVCRLRRNQFLFNLHTGWSLTENTIPYAVLILLDFLMMSTEMLETCRWL